MATSEKIIELRQLLSDRFPEAHQAHRAAGKRFVTGVASLDAIGIPQGAITEIVSPHPSAGSASLISIVVKTLIEAGRTLALIDGRDSFDPQPLGAEACRRLLWVRCHHAHQSVKAADLVLRDGNLPFVILDLRLNPPRELRRLPNQIWFRLQTLVKKTSTACLAMTPKTIIASARLRITLVNSFHIEDLERNPSELLEMIDTEVTRRRYGVSSLRDRDQFHRELAG